MAESIFLTAFKAKQELAATQFMKIAANSEISILKQKLAETDYKVIQCMESHLLGEKELPHDMSQLNKDRQVLRDKINELEKV